MAPAERWPLQARHALAALVRGFTTADQPQHDGGALLHDVAAVADDADVDDDHVASGLRAVVLRLVFLLCARPREVVALARRLREDAARAPSLLRARHGAWARLLVLFRRVHDDPRTRSGLFDPDRWPFLEGRRRPASAGPRPATGAPPRLPRVPDDVVLRVLGFLIDMDGAPVDHAALDPTVLGVVYEHLRGFSVRRTTEPSLAVGPRHVVVGVASLLALDAEARAPWLKDRAGIALSRRAGIALVAARSVDDVVAALARRASSLTPALVAEGALVLVPSDARRRAGLHYTPRALTEAVVRATLDPLVAALGPRPQPEALLALSVCDPAMGAGAFLVQACRHLAVHVVAAASAHGRTDLAPAEARRRVARECLYGVDIDEVAVWLARLSLWLVAGGPDDAWSFADPRLRRGDALVGFARAQIERFDWHDPPRASPSSPMSAASDDEHAPEQLRRRGDALAAVFLAHDRVGAREAARAHAAAHGPNDRSPTPPAFHWELEFPAVFAGASPGFCAVVGNPPFLNAIEARTGRSTAKKALYAQLYPAFAQGAYDLCVLFLARTTTTLLRRDGRYGLLVPQALLSAHQPWRRFLHDRWRPDALLSWPVDRFDGAAIRVVALVGGAGRAAACDVVVDDGAGQPARHVHRFGDDDVSWYDALTPPERRGSADAADAADADPLALSSIPLSSRFVVHAGCATGVAYALRPLVVDAKEPGAPEALQLVTTGALDRFCLRWHDDVVRFLKRDHRFPRWPAGEPPAVPRALARARDAQRRPKLLVGGLSAVLEAWFDAHGAAGGVVSTWVIAPRPPAPAAAAIPAADAAIPNDTTALKALAVLVNAATSSRAFLRLHGAAAMSGHQTTIKKAALLQHALPDVFADHRGFDAPAFACALPAVLEPMAPAATTMMTARFVDQLAALHDRLAAAASWSSSSSSFDAIDAFAHVVVARLCGRTRRQAVDDLRWWNERTRRHASDRADDCADVDALAARVYALPVVAP